jgi:RNA polymerase sigma factor (sigma-70 family)
MKTKWELTEEAFNLFLSWLAPDCDAAAQQYEKLRLRLIMLFHNRGCAVAEDLADETFNRVMRRLPAIIETYVGAPAAYIQSAAHSVYLDYLEKRWEPLPEQMPEPPHQPAEEQEQLYACLERCVARLSPHNRDLVIQYYRENKQAKIDHRKQLAERLGIALSVLRIRLHRLRRALRECIEACLEQQPAPELYLEP